jgi:peptide/nickel transport system permease protein
MMTEAYAPQLIEIAGPTSRTLLRRRILGHKGLLLGAGLLIFILAMALLAPVLAPFDPYEQDLANRLVPPIWHERGNWAHVLGTDNLGRDYLSRVIYGARISLLIGIAVMVISGLIGSTLGLAAGYFGGRTDMVVTFVVTVRLALPVILVALAVVAMVGGSLWIVVLVLGLLKWDRFAVVMRATTQQVRALDYVAAAEASGASTARIIVGEVLPNVLPQLIVVASVEAASAILLEAALSFLGLGVQPPLPSWGLMIAEAKTYMFFSFWLIAIPGTALAVLVLAINMLGDGIRDVTAPTGRG